jgi:hypothetical protein
MNSEYLTFKNQTFCILKFEKKYLPNAEDPELEKSIKNSGTGFFISSQGHFLTAGHVLLDESNFNYFVVIEKTFYPITIIKKQYRDLKDQKEPIFYDFAFGKINFNSKQFIKFQKNETIRSLMVIGFCKTSIENPDDEPIIDIDDLIYEEVQFEEIAVLDQRKFGGFPGVYVSDKFIQVAKLENGENIGGEFSNGFKFKYAYHIFIPPNGMSGGPVINSHDNTLAGIFTNGTIDKGICLTLTNEQIMWIEEEICT